jgi:hypothetical protein
MHGEPHPRRYSRSVGSEIDLAAWSFAAFTHIAAAIRLLAVASRALWRQGKRPVFLRSPDAVEQSSESARKPVAEMRARLQARQHLWDSVAGTARQFRVCGQYQTRTVILCSIGSETGRLRPMTSFRSKQVVNRISNYMDRLTGRKTTNAAPCSSWGQQGE